MPLVPADISAGSHRSVWWRCEKRTQLARKHPFPRFRCGCPVCAGRQILVGENDLATVDPELAQEWDTARNGKLTPQDVLPGTEKKGLVGLRTRASLAGGGLCTDEQAKWLPILFRKTGAARLQRPCVTKSGACRTVGHGTKRNAHPAAGHSLTSNRKAWWICEKGHSFQAVIASRAKGTGCPYCTNRKVLAGFNDLATVEPRIAAEWHPTLNGALTPGDGHSGQHKKVSGGEILLGHASGRLPSTRTARRNAVVRSAPGKPERKGTGPRPGGKHCLPLAGLI